MATKYDDMKLASGPTSRPVTIYPEPCCSECGEIDCCCNDDDEEDSRVNCMICGNRIHSTIAAFRIVEEWCCSTDCLHMHSIEQAHTITSLRGSLNLVRLTNTLIRR